MKYQTVDVTTIQQELFRISTDLLNDLLGLSLEEPPVITFTMPDVLSRSFDKAFILELGESLR
jgi:hypothetical protein